MFKRLIICTALVLNLTAFAMPAAAMTVPHQVTQVAACQGGLSSFLGLEPWYSCLQKKYGSIQITTLNDIWLIVLPVLEDFIRAAGFIAAGFILWGGIKYLKSQGNSSETTQARDIIKNAVIGLIWVLLSVSVVEFVAVGIQQGV